jgi:hypothetical protein
MQPFGFPQLDAALQGCCGEDGSVTRSQLPCGSYLCPACIREYRERGWLDAGFEHTEAFFAEHRHLWWLRVRRKGREQVVIDAGRVVADLRTLLASGESVEGALRRLQSEARVGHFYLVRAVISVLRVEPREARRLVVRAVGSNAHEGGS